MGSRSPQKLIPYLSLLRNLVLVTDVILLIPGRHAVGGGPGEAEVFLSFYIDREIKVLEVSSLSCLAVGQELD